MKRWIKQGICALTLGAMLTANVLAAELSLSFDKQGTTAAVHLQDVGTDRYAAEVTFSLSSTQSVQFQGKADSYAVTIDSAAGSVTLYAASRTPLTVSNGALDLGTLTVAANTEVTGSATAIVLDRSLNRFTYSDAEITVIRDSVDVPDGNPGGDNSGSNGSSTGGGASSSGTPSVSVNGTGGKVKAASDGSVTITPDDGYRIARILVNGKEVAVTTKLTGLKASDVVVVTFEKIENASEPTVSFTDVADTDWYADAVQFVVSKNLFQGMSATEFGPNVEMNRAMLVTVLYRMSGEQAKSSSTFTDVAPDAWYASAVAWARENGIVTGVTDTTFNPNGSVTREQMATILYRYAQYQGDVPNADQTVLDDFTDAASVSTYAVPTMSWAVQEGLLSGVGHQKLSPGGSATRAQVAVILQRFLEKNS